MSWDKQKLKWRVAFNCDRKTHFVGYFANEEAAARAYNAAFVGMPAAPGRAGGAVAVRWLIVLLALVACEPKAPARIDDIRTPPDDYN